ncbi:helix-turn-helix domain-containing protein [Pseudomonas chlororaphis]|uniref:AraC family transcriptional regulator n=1 Tax=Pseudomonas chlororaphis TaxID=587753 RepID=A0A1Q8EMD4_9PSED|nr:helix-turn-helix domain-containing protein [Pseudomonas chlororaphis]OLF52948.1 AraC family transcriptional regulator [Pseudomonas chlororaphis]
MNTELPDETLHVTPAPVPSSTRTIGQWEINLTSLEHEATVRQHTLVQGPRLQCSRLEFDSGVTLTGCVPHGFVTFAIALAAVRRPTVNSHPLRPNEIIVLHSGEPVHCTCEPNETLLILTTTLEHYAQCLDEHSTIDLLAKRREYRFQAANFKSIQSAIQAINACVIDAPPATPSRPSETSGTERALLASLLRALTPVGRSALKPPTRRKIALEAIEYIHENTKKQLNIKTLAKQLQTTTRSLHHGFVETFGTSPIAYIRNLRLANVRQDLLHNTWPTVTETAMYWNFHHLGRFSKLYQDTYGEIPSETARRHCAKLKSSSR